MSIVNDTVNWLATKSRQVTTSASTSPSSSFEDASPILRPRRTRKISGNSAQFAGDRGREVPGLVTVLDLKKLCEGASNTVGDYGFL